MPSGCPASDRLSWSDCLFIENLRDRRSFHETVVDRIWRTWSQAAGQPRSIAEGPVNQSLTATRPIPLCLVAHEGDVFHGTVTLIDHDPEYPDHHAPWIDALWVEPHTRGSGLAQTLLDRAVRAAGQAGHDHVYLEALDGVQPFYTRLGWQMAGRSPSRNDLAVMRLAVDQALVH